MRLRRVTITGFKTFARRTEVVLGDGVTAVVGPNGSGKSNLVDAIRWALGETNARELRGARMDEIIHSGGRGRPALGYASVDLVLDNGDGRLPVDDAEVQISRRVTRDGGSEYRLNGGRVRLRDLERLLGATGLTQAGYAVVAQNDVDGIIEATPAQRRVLVEEAAGVRGLRSARDDALARVNQVEGRLVRLADLLEEAEPRLAELAAQCVAALEQRAVSARLSELRGSLAREEWRAARGILRRAKQRLDTAQSRLAAAAEAEAGFDERLTRDRTAVAEAAGRLAAQRRRLEDARLEVERSDGERGRHADRAATSAHARAVVAAEGLQAEADVARLRAGLADLAAEADAATAILARATDALAEHRTAHAESSRRAGGSVSVLREAEGGARSAEARAVAAEQAHRDLATRAGLLDDTAAGLIGAAAAAASRASELEAAAVIAAREETAAAEAAAALAVHAAAAAGEETASRTAVAALEEERAVAVARLREVDARAAALRGQIDGALEAGPVAAAVGSQALLGRRLVECFRVVRAADEAAVEAVLEGHLGAWLVDDLEAARQLMSADGNREEVVVRRPATERKAQQPPRLPAGVRMALHAITPDGEATAALTHLLDGCWLAPDRVAADVVVGRLGGRAALPDGTVISAAGVRGGGRPGVTIALATAERDAVATLASLIATESDLANRVSVATETATGAHAARELAIQRAEAARTVAARAAAAAVAATTAAAAERERRSQLDAERAEREAAATAARSEAVAAEAAAAAQRAAADSALAELDRCRHMADADRASLATALGALGVAEIDVARAEPEAREAQRRLAAARASVDQVTQRATSLGLRLLTAEQECLAALARGGAATARVAAARAAAEAAQTEVEAAEGPLRQARAALDALEDERREVAVAAARARDEEGAAIAELAAATARVGALAKVASADGEPGGPEPDADAIERAEREIGRLERRVSALGPVNALAPEQHEVLAARVRRLQEDRDDLRGACDDVRWLAEHLLLEIDHRFSQVFDEVRAHFAGLFAELFPGGTAELRLAGSAPGGSGAAAGIAILAQPPGKRLQSLSLLSGGERALTALAVILALQHVNPSPFYVFDEVDAPLDDANIARFTRLLGRLSTDQQFLVVTHNHATMAAADALYGVTMGGDGISRLLSVRFLAGEPVPITSPRTPVAAAS